MDISNVRVVDNASAYIIIQNVRALYHYDRNKHDYWYPLNINDLPYDEENALFIQDNIIEAKLNDIKELYNIDNGIYCILAYWMKEDYVLEINDLDFKIMNNVCMEYFCVTKDFSSVIYVSHEGTVTFAGEKLDAVKTILESLKHEWNKYHGG